MVKIILDGKHLLIRDVNAIVNNPNLKIESANGAILRVRRSFKFLKNELELNKKIIYGVNTGFGPMASHILGIGQLTQLQENLVRSHAVGMGNPIEDRFVLAAMVVRLNTLLKGHSGVSEELIRQLETYINLRIIPIIPEHGAVGTSGDLVQLAHIGLALIGEGQVNYQERKFQTSELLRKLAITPYKLKPKEGLSLINGTSMMAGVAALLCAEADHLTSLAVHSGALALELVSGFSDSISERLHQFRPQKGQITVARQLRQILSSSKLLKDRLIFQSRYKSKNDVQLITEAVQEVYSLRCIAQILGPVYDTLIRTNEVVNIELNSVTDNPIVDIDRKTFLHGGNFHGDYVASSVDQLKIALIKLSILSERRINFFLNQNINKFFPAFMNLKKIGLNLGLQGLQFVATSTTALNQSLGYPHHLHSISTNGDNQDVVSMGTDAAMLGVKVLENAHIVLTIELITLAQAVDFLGVERKLSKPSRNIYKQIRKILPAIKEDRELGDQLQAVLAATKKLRLLNNSS
ncbi:MAG TPA: aromatic amino acid ammonia-lyase [Patescibacteria group bacterium]|nr:aromatic amino acid ammonia-lyase [Patescibacteria group bacterium]